MADRVVFGPVMVFAEGDGLSMRRTIELDGVVLTDQLGGHADLPMRASDVAAMTAGMESFTKRVLRRGGDRVEALALWPEPLRSKLLAALDDDDQADRIPCSNYRGYRGHYGP